MVATLLSSCRFRGRLSDLAYSERLRYLLLDFSPIDGPVRDTLEFALNA
jgi:hypothetical protein